MKHPTDVVYRELGKLFMESVVLREALGSQQRETVRMAHEVDTERMRGEKLSRAMVEQEKNLIALNERLIGKKAD